MSGQDVFKALSDPSRRRILKILKDGSRTAGELAESFDITKGSLSHHFNVLKAADLVRSERRGQQIVYSLNTSVLYVGQAVGSAIGGLLFARDLFHAAGYVAAAFVALALTTVILTKPKKV